MASADDLAFELDEPEEESGPRVIEIEGEVDEGEDSDFLDLEEEGEQSQEKNLTEVLDENRQSWLQQSLQIESRMKQLVLFARNSVFVLDKEARLAKSRPPVPESETADATDPTSEKSTPRNFPTDLDISDIQRQLEFLVTENLAYHHELQQFKRRYREIETMLVESLVREEAMVTKLRGSLAKHRFRDDQRKKLIDFELFGRIEEYTNITDFKVEYLALVNGLYEDIPEVPSKMEPLETFLEYEIVKKQHGEFISRCLDGITADKKSQFEQAERAAFYDIQSRFQEERDQLAAEHEADMQRAEKLQRFADKHLARRANTKGRYDAWGGVRRLEGWTTIKTILSESPKAAELQEEEERRRKELHWKFMRGSVKEVIDFQKAKVLVNTILDEWLTNQNQKARVVSEDIYKTIYRVMYRDGRADWKMRHRQALSELREIRRRHNDLDRTFRNCLSSLQFQFERNLNLALVSLKAVTDAREEEKEKAAQRLNVLRSRIQEIEKDNRYLSSELESSQHIIETERESWMQQIQNLRRSCEKIAEAAKKKEDALKAELSELRRTVSQVRASQNERELEAEEEMLMLTQEVSKLSGQLHAKRQREAMEKELEAEAGVARVPVLPTWNRIAGGSWRSNQPDSQHYQQGGGRGGGGTAPVSGADGGGGDTRKRQPGDQGDLSPELLLDDTRSAITSRPHSRGSSERGSRPSTPGLSRTSSQGMARPTSPRGISRPSSTGRISRPTSSGRSSRPNSSGSGRNSARSSRPNSSGRASRPSTSGTSSRPSTPGTSSRPSTSGMSSGGTPRPSSSGRSSRPQTASSERSFSSRSSRPQTASSERSSPSRLSRPQTASSERSDGRSSRPPTSGSDGRSSRPPTSGSDGRSSRPSSRSSGRSSRRSSTTKRPHTPSSDRVVLSARSSRPKLSRRATATLMVRGGSHLSSVSMKKLETIPDFVNDEEDDSRGTPRNRIRRLKVLLRRKEEREKSLVSELERLRGRAVPSKRWSFSEEDDKMSVKSRRVRQTKTVQEENVEMRKSLLRVKRENEGLGRTLTKIRRKNLNLKGSFRKMMNLENYYKVQLFKFKEKVKQLEAALLSARKAQENARQVRQVHDKRRQTAREQSARPGSRNVEPRTSQVSSAVGKKKAAVDTLRERLYHLREMEKVETGVDREIVALRRLCQRKERELASRYRHMSPSQRVALPKFNSMDEQIAYAESLRLSRLDEIGKHEAAGRIVTQADYLKVREMEELIADMKRLQKKETNQTTLDEDVEAIRSLRDSKQREIHQREKSLLKSRVEVAKQLSLVQKQIQRLKKLEDEQARAHAGAKARLMELERSKNTQLRNIERLRSLQRDQQSECLRLETEIAELQKKKITDSETTAKTESTAPVTVGETQDMVVTISPKKGSGGSGSHSPEIESLVATKIAEIEDRKERQRVCMAELQRLEAELQTMNAKESEMRDLEKQKLAERDVLRKRVASQKMKLEERKKAIKAQQEEHLIMMRKAEDRRAALEARRVAIRQRRAKRRKKLAILRQHLDSKNLELKTRSAELQKKKLLLETEKKVIKEESDRFLRLQDSASGRRDGRVQLMIKKRESLQVRLDAKSTVDVEFDRLTRKIAELEKKEDALRRSELPNQKVPLEKLQRRMDRVCGRLKRLGALENETLSNLRQEIAAIESKIEQLTESDRVDDGAEKELANSVAVVEYGPIDGEEQALWTEVEESLDETQREKLLRGRAAMVKARVGFVPPKGVRGVYVEPLNSSQERVQGKSPSTRPKTAGAHIRTSPVPTLLRIEPSQRPRSGRMFGRVRRGLPAVESRYGRQSPAQKETLGLTQVSLGGKTQQRQPRRSKSPSEQHLRPSFPKQESESDPVAAMKVRRFEAKKSATEEYRQYLRDVESGKVNDDFLSEHLPALRSIAPEGQESESDEDNAFLEFLEHLRSQSLEEEEEIEPSESENARPGLGEDFVLTSIARRTSSMFPNMTPSKLPKIRRRHFSSAASRPADQISSSTHHVPLDSLPSPPTPRGFGSIPSRPRERPKTAGGSSFSARLRAETARVREVAEERKRTLHGPPFVGNMVMLKHGIAPHPVLMLDALDVQKLPTPPTPSDEDEKIESPEIWKLS